MHALIHLRTAVNKFNARHGCEVSIFHLPDGDVCLMNAGAVICAGPIRKCLAFIVNVSPLPSSYGGSAINGDS